MIQKLPRDPSTGFQGGGGSDGQQIAHTTGMPQTMIATAQVPASSSTSTASSGGGAMVSLRTNISEKNAVGANIMSGADPPMIGAPNDAVLSSRLPSHNIGIPGGNHSQPIVDFRSLNTMGKVEARSHSKTS